MELFDGSYNKLTDKKITVVMLSHIDDEDNHFQILSEITDHKSDGNDISISDGFINSINGKNVPKKTTDVWKLQLKRKDGSSYWVTQRYLKASINLQLA